MDWTCIWRLFMETLQYCEGLRNAWRIGTTFKLGFRGSFTPESIFPNILFGCVYFCLFSSSGLTSLPLNVHEDIFLRSIRRIFLRIIKVFLRSIRICKINPQRPHRQFQVPSVNRLNVKQHNWLLNCTHRNPFVQPYLLCFIIFSHDSKREYAHTCTCSW